MTITLEQYCATERRMDARDAKVGLVIHGAVTVAVCVVVVLVNVLVASEFPWAIFPVLGMTIGVAAHCYFGVHHGQREMLRHQRAVEQQAELAG